MVSPALAAKIGLEEATLLSVLDEAARFVPSQQSNGAVWFQLSEAVASQLMPFWQAQDIQRLVANLRTKGLLVVSSPPYTASRFLKYAFNNRAVAAPLSADTLSHAVVTRSAAGPGLNLIAPNWQPDADTLGQIAQHNIPETFIQQQVPEFVLYWRERQEPARAWGSKFLKQVLVRWRDFEAEQHVKRNQTPINFDWRPSDEVVQALIRAAGLDRKQVELAIPRFIHYWTMKGGVPENWNLEFHTYANRQFGKSQTAMEKGWRPSEDAMEVLMRTGISREFIEDTIPEFELYWREQGAESDNWHRKFRDHVQRQWASYTSALEHDRVPKRIAPDWQPSADVYDVLRLANIDLAFARSLLPEFVIYWQDSNQVHHSWNTRYLQYVKMRWARRDAGDINNKSTRDISLVEELTDRSWAD